MAITFSGFFIIAIACALFGVWMIIDCLMNQKEDKLVWVIVLVFLNFFGALLYFFIARSKRIDECRQFTRKFDVESVEHSHIDFNKF